MNKDSPGNFLEMSDEDFTQLNAPPEVMGGEEEQEQQQEEEQSSTVVPDTEEVETGNQEEEEQPDPEGKEEPEKEEEPVKQAPEDYLPDTETGEKKPEPEEEDKPKEEADSKATQGKDDKAAATDEQLTDEEKAAKKAEEEKSSDTVDYKSFYEQIMKPFKANGREVELKSPDEVIQLMQMGANYTKKMQSIAPYKKTLLMLENNGLMNEDKLSYLIDLDKKNPEAIKKLVKDAGIDPMDIDTDGETAYQKGNHRVSDEEFAFRSVLDDLTSTPTGSETLQAVNTHWDQASKDALWKTPDVLQVIHEHRGSGIYDRISDEVERRRTLGQINQSTPFLYAYKQVGDEMASAGAFNDLLAQKPAQPEPQKEAEKPVDTRVQAPKPKVSNADKVSAAASTRSTAKKAESKVNPLAMSDEDFMKMAKQFENRI